MRHRHLFIYLCLFGLPQLASAQSNIDVKAFRAMSTAERLNYLYDPERSWKDTTQFLAWYNPMLAAAESEGDEKAMFALLYEHFQQRHAFLSLKDNVVELESALLEAAKEYDVKEGEVVAEHYMELVKTNTNFCPANSYMPISCSNMKGWRTLVLTNLSSTILQGCSTILGGSCSNWEDDEAENSADCRKIYGTNRQGPSSLDFRQKPYSEHLPAAKAIRFKHPLRQGNHQVDEQMSKPKPKLTACSVRHGSE